MELAAIWPTSVGSVTNADADLTTEPAAGEPAAGESGAGEPGAGEPAAGEPGVEANTDAERPSEAELDVIERDLADVEIALARLSDGTYWNDEATGESISEQVLDADPTTRRA